MNNSPKNATHLDPYKDFKFRVFANDQEIPDISAVHQSHGWQASEGTPGSDAATSAEFRLNISDPITLERGLTPDASIAEWMSHLLTLANQPGGLADISLISREVRIEQINHAEEVISVWQAQNCRPSEYRSPKNHEDQNSSSPEVLILLHDGCERIS